MPPLPPATEVLSMLQSAVLPAAGGAALVLCMFMVFGRWADALGSALAVVAGFVWANFTFTKLSLEDTGYPLPWKPGEEMAGWYWLPRAALVLIVVGLLSRWLGLIAARFLPEGRWWIANVLVWLPRIAAVAVVSAWLVVGRANADWPVMKPEMLRLQIAGAMILLWITLDGLARAIAHREPDDFRGFIEDGPAARPGAEVAAYLAVTFLAAGTILLYAHSKLFMEVAVILGFAMFGIAVAAGVGKADTSGAVPAAVAFLPGLVFGGRPSLAENNVPPLCFWLVALAPLALAPFLIPVVARQNGVFVRVVRVLLVLAPIVAAIMLASKHEKLVFEEW